MYSVCFWNMFGGDRTFFMPLVYNLSKLDNKLKSTYFVLGLNFVQHGLNLSTSCDIKMWLATTFYIVLFYLHVSK